MQRRGKDEAAPPAIGFSHCIAKTHSTAGGAIEPGRRVPEHCRIVGEVARELVRRWPVDVAEKLFPAGSVLVAACHDIGKVSPTFQQKLRNACAAGIGDWPALSVNPGLEKLWGGHAGVSQLTAQAIGTPRYVPEILGEHHGFSPPIAGKRASDEAFGGAAWQVQRVALVDDLKSQLHSDWPLVESTAQARLLAGLTCVADWIGSGHFFEDPAEPWQSNIERAVDDAGFITPIYRPGLSFADVFGFAARSVQQTFIDTVTTPGVYVLEAPMGIGKTEAALFAAYRMLLAHQATGVYFALPTQLTSNKIHERFNAFLSAILAPECRHRGWLLHSKAWLVDTEMGEEGRPGGAWFNHAKRGLLAPFAVGTVDQALMAAMRVKHGFVRAFGLAGKVVILDEVHTYDAYTGTLLDALIALLRELGATVIILSATLSGPRRTQILGATLTSNAYPLLTALPSGSPTLEIPLAPGRTTLIGTRLERNDINAINEALTRAGDGQQVLWIENTVPDAQQRYLDLAARAAEIGVACGLLHSRFTAADRQRLEAQWVACFGKSGYDRRLAQGRILVGTQVLEQSLDIDADFLVTRFAPTDMLLQRMGRLWRHAQTPRPTSAQPEAWLLVPDLATAIEQPPAAFGATAYVYAPYVLCRSLDVWQGIATVSLPGDIRELIERTYDERSETGAMARWAYELEQGTQGTPRHLGRDALRRLAAVYLAEEGNTQPESKAQTRYSESESAEVLLLRDLQQHKDSRTTRLALLDGTVVDLPWDQHRLPLREWKCLTAQLMAQQVPVRIGDAPLAPSRDTLKKLGFGHCFYLGDENWAQDESLLRVALVDDSARLSGIHGAPVHERHILEYRDDLGYRVIKT